PPPETYTLSLHDALPILETPPLQLGDEAAELPVAVRDLAVVLRDEAVEVQRLLVVAAGVDRGVVGSGVRLVLHVEGRGRRDRVRDRKSTRLNSSHVSISY